MCFVIQSAAKNLKEDLLEKLCHHLLAKPTLLSTLLRAVSIKFREQGIDFYLFELMLFFVKVLRAIKISNAITNNEMAIDI